jgi:hypothetical protein
LAMPTALWPRPRNLINRRSLPPMEELEQSERTACHP